MLHSLRSAQSVLGAAMKMWGVTLALVILSSTVARADTLIERVSDLQVIMQQHIEKTKIDGALLYLNFNSGTIERLYPVEAHPMIIEIEGGYVLCADLAREDGSTVPLDVYIVEDGGDMVVFDTIVANRAPLAKLIKAGKATRIR